MPRNARCVLPGTPYHVTQRGTDRQRIFFLNSDRELYLHLLQRNLATTHVRLLAYALMPNHVHAVVVPERDDSLARLFRRVHGRYAQYINTRRDRCGHLWQGRFYSCPLSFSRLPTALRYVELNPCRAGLVDQPEDYRWSSAATHLNGVADPFGILDLRFFDDAGGVDTWQGMYDEPMTDEIVEDLRNCTYAGRPFGDEEFIVDMEARFGRVWRRQGQIKTAVA